MLVPISDWQRWLGQAQSSERLGAGACQVDTQGAPGSCGSCGCSDTRQWVPYQPENFACVEAEKGGEWHFPSSGVAEALDDPEQPHVLASWGWLQAFLGY